MLFPRSNFCKTKRTSPLSSSIACGELQSLQGACRTSNEVCLLHTAKLHLLSFSYSGPFLGKSRNPARLKTDLKTLEPRLRPQNVVHIDIERQEYRTLEPKTRSPFVLTTLLRLGKNRVARPLIIAEGTAPKSSESSATPCLPPATLRPTSSQPSACSQTKPYGTTETGTLRLERQRSSKWSSADDVVRGRTQSPGKPTTRRSSDRLPSIEDTSTTSPRDNVFGCEAREISNVAPAGIAGAIDDVDSWCAVHKVLERTTATGAHEKK